MEASLPGVRGRSGVHSSGCDAEVTHLPYCEFKVELRPPAEAPPPRLEAGSATAACARTCRGGEGGS